MKTRISCRLSVPLAGRLRAAAKSAGCTVTAMFTRFLEEGVCAQQRRDSLLLVRQRRLLSHWSVIGPLEEPSESQAAATPHVADGQEASIRIDLESRPAGLPTRLFRLTLLKP